MPITLYELCGADPDVRFSPPCWTVKFALLHKGLEFETVPLRFTEKQNYPDPDYKLLPVLKDGDTLVRDSSHIAAYLDANYPDNPLFQSEGEKAAHDFYRAFAGAHLFPALAPLTFALVPAAVAPEDATYFRETREKRLGKSLEEATQQEGLAQAAQSALASLATPLNNHSFYGGAEPNLSDYMLAGVFMWRRALVATDPYETPQAMRDWFERILDLFDGYGRTAKTAIS